MYSSNLWDIAKRNNLWTETTESDGLLDFLKTFAPPRAHSPYATRRIWRIFNIAAPSLQLNPYTDPYASEYPFSVKVEKVLTHQNIIDINVSY